MVPTSPMVAATKAVQVKSGLERSSFRSITEFVFFITVTELLAFHREAVEAVRFGVEVSALESGGAELGVEDAEVPGQCLSDGGEVKHDDGDADAGVGDRHQFADC